MIVNLLIWTIIFLASLFVLIKSSDYFLDSVEAIGLSLGIPSFILGATFVAFGTSLPELTSSILAVLKDSSEIVAGNVIGSNITNIFLVLGVAAVVGKKLIVGYELIHIDLPLLMGSVFLLAVTIWDGIFILPEALFCIAAFSLYFFYVFNGEKRLECLETKKDKDVKIRKRNLNWKILLVFILSTFFIYLGAEYIIEAIIRLSAMLNIGKEIIAMSAVALGTSLPEFCVTITAARKGKAEIAVGNILGSNIFNSLGVTGISALFGSLVIPEGILSYGLPILLIGTLLYFFTTQDSEITKWEGWMFIIFYVFFIGKLFNLF